MRLRNLLSLLENADLDALRLNAKQLDTGYSFTGVQAFKRTVDYLAAIPAFDAPVRALRTSALGPEEKDYLDQRNQVAAEDIRESSQALYHGARSLLVTLREIMPPDAAETLNVYIPDPVNIRKLIYVCGKLEKALQGSIVGEYTKGKSAIRHIDPCANWIEIDVGTEEALRLAADLVWSAAVVYGKYQEAKVFEEHVRALNLRPESLEDIRKGQSEAIVRLIHSESRSLVEKHLHGNGGQLERLKVPIKLMADLIKDGIRVYPPDSSPEAVKRLFPDFDKLGSIESKAEKAEPDQAPALDLEAETAGAAIAEDPTPKENSPVKEAAKTESAREPKPKPAAEPKPQAPVLPKQASFNDTVDLEF